jgi:hypothetical protein
MVDEAVAEEPGVKLAVAVTVAALQVVVDEVAVVAGFALKSKMI